MIMLTKVYIAPNAFEQALVILNLFYFQMRKEKLRCYASTPATSPCKWSYI